MGNCVRRETGIEDHEKDQVNSKQLEDAIVFFIMNHFIY
jgi:hypothetical protein